MTLASSIRNLKESHDVLVINWDRAREGWRDVMAERMRQEVIDPLDGRVRAALQALQQMDEVMASARSECM